MTDERFIFVSDVAEKKRVARGSHNRRTHAGKGGKVILPSDRLTRKELQSMNGEIKTYNLNSPMTWAEYKSMPDDLKTAYLTKLRDTYNTTNKAIGDMMGVSDSTIRNETKRLGIRPPQRSERCSPGWADFVGGGAAPCEPLEETAKPADDLEAPGEPYWEDMFTQAAAERDKLKTLLDAVMERAKIMEAKLSMVELIFGGKKDKE